MDISQRSQFDNINSFLAIVMQIVKIVKGRSISQTLV